MRRFSVVGLMLVAALSGQQPPCTIERVAGGGTIARGDGGPAVEAELFNPVDARRGPDGALYIADAGHHRIRRVNPNGIIETFAGTGRDAISGDGGSAIEAGLSSPRSLAFTPDGSLYFLDFGPAPQLRRISREGIISTIAGAHRSNFSGDGGPASEAGLMGAVRIAAGPDGSIYIASQSIHRIRRITPGHRVETVAGASNPFDPRGFIDGDAGPAVLVGLDRPTDVAVDSAGVVYFADRNGTTIRRILLDGTVETYIGRRGTSAADGTPRADVGLRRTTREIEIDGQDRVYWGNTHGIRRVGSDDRIETVWTFEQFQVIFLFPIFVQPDGEVLRSFEDKVLWITGADTEIVVAGRGFDAPRGDGGSALEATLTHPSGLATGPGDKVFIADRTRVRQLSGSTIEAFVGSGLRGEASVNVPAIESAFRSVSDVAVAADGTVYVADSDDFSVYAAAADNTLTRVAGRGTSCLPSGAQCGDGGPATQADLWFIHDLVVDGGGNLYISHLQRGPTDRLRKVTPGGSIETLRFPDGEPVDASAIGSDPNGNLLIATGSRPADAKFWRVTPHGQFNEIEGLPGFANDGEVVAGDADGNIYFSDLGSNVRRLTPAGLLSSIYVPPEQRVQEPFAGMVAGNFVLDEITDFAVDDRGDLYISDRAGRVARITKPDECASVERPQIALFGINSAASFVSRLAPGALFSLFGIGLGPADGVSGRIEGGRLTTKIAEVRVLVDGVPAPLIFSSDGQINGIVPYGTSAPGEFRTGVGFLYFHPERAASFVVEFNGVSSEPGFASVTPTAPALFTRGANSAAALNEDGTVNGPLSPASTGSIVVLFGSGAGIMDPPSADGEITANVLPKPVEPVEVTFDDEPAEILYAGAAPGLVSGVIQINARIPAELQRFGSVRVSLKIGRLSNKESQNVSVVIERR